jgi:hypothetical protein
MSDPLNPVTPPNDPTLRKPTLDDFERVLRQVLLSDDEELKSRVVMEPLKYVEQVLNSDDVDNELKLRAAKVLIEGAIASKGAE